MGGKSLILAHQLADKNVLLVGGGEVALTRLRKLIPTGARVTMVAPQLHPTLRQHYCSFASQNDHHQTDTLNDHWRPNTELYRLIAEPFGFHHLDLYREGNDSGWALILTCIPDKALGLQIYQESKKRFGSQQTVNVADNPPLCDVYFGANLEFGATDAASMQLMISSNGMGPRYVALVRDEIARMLQGIDFETSLARLGSLRHAVRQIASDDALDTKYRMNWMKQCTDAFGVKNCERLDVEQLTALFGRMYSDNKSLRFPPRQEMCERYLQNKEL